VPVIADDSETNEVIQDTHPEKQRQALPAEDPIKKGACSKQQHPPVTGREQIIQKDDKREENNEMKRSECHTDAV
jgi:hypothetical protein